MAVVYASVRSAERTSCTSRGVIGRPCDQRISRTWFSSSPLGSFLLMSSPRRVAYRGASMQWNRCRVLRVDKLHPIGDSLGGMSRSRWRTLLRAAEVVAIGIVGLILVSAVLPTDAPGSSRSFEIGRAACRARVCQYV